MRITDTHVYFWRGTFSNWYPCKFIDYGYDVTFKTTEQAFMWYKARYFGDNETAQKILLALTPKGAKDLGRLVRNYNDEKWNIVRLDYMISVNLLKFGQNRELKQHLLDTRNRTLVEASPYDKIWGVGLGEDNNLILDQKNWLGENLLGKALMEVRRLL